MCSWPNIVQIMGIHLLCLANTRQKHWIVSLSLSIYSLDWFPSLLIGTLNKHTSKTNKSNKSDSAKGRKETQTQSSTHRFLLLVYILNLYWQDMYLIVKDWNNPPFSHHSLLKQLIMMINNICTSSYGFSRPVLKQDLHYFRVWWVILTWDSLLHWVWASYAWRCFPKDSCQQMGPFV